MSSTTKSPKIVEAMMPIFFEVDAMPSMDDLLGKEEEGNNFAEGNIVTGKIVTRRDDGAMIDIGFKSEGFVPRDEFPDWASVEVGHEVRAVLEELEGDDELPVLSVSKAIFEEAWRAFSAKYDEGSIVTGAIKYRVKGGLMVDIGVDAFLPGSQVDITPVRNMDDYVGHDFEFKILKVNKERRNVVISRRELLEQEKAKMRATLLEEIEPGQRRTGIVKNITDFGAFVDLRGIDGLIHITDMSWGRINHPTEMVKVGDELEVVILDVDRDRERVSLGLKQKFPDPWEGVAQKYPSGTRIRGRVVNVMPYGAFVEIEEGVEGLIHVSEMSWTKRITRAGDVVAVDQELDAVVLDVQQEAKKISLGLRQTMENPWEQAAEKYPPGTRISGKVRNMTSYGAFIEIEEDIDGMVHVSDMSWTRKINNPAEVLKKGDEVEAMVLDIDPDQQRISLGLKQLQEDPWERIDTYYHVGDSVKGAVTKLTNFGAFIELEHGIDGLIHISQISDERVNKVKDVLNVGDEVEAKVIKIDRQERRIGLSMKTSPSAADMEGAYDRRGDDDLRPGENMVGLGDAFDDAFGDFDPDNEK